MMGTIERDRAAAAPLQGQTYMYQHPWKHDNLHEIVVMVTSQEMGERDRMYALINTRSQATPTRLHIHIA